MSKITLGADPELCIYDRNTGRQIPGWEITAGEKLGKHEDIGKGVTVHADGVALEFNFPPAPPIDFANQALDALRTVTNFVKKKIPDAGVAFIGETNNFSKEDLEHPIAKMIGCDPDYDAYSSSGDVPRVLNNEIMLPYANTKFFGGHLHVGYNKDKCPPWAAVRLMDALVYGPLLRYENSGARKIWYGKAGSYRPKSYGLEYRTPSAFWLKDRTLPMHIGFRANALFDAIHNRTQDVFALFEATDWTQMETWINERDTNAYGHWLATTAMPFRRQIDPDGAIW